MLVRCYCDECENIGADGYCEAESGTIYISGNTLEMNRLHIYAPICTDYKEKEEQDE